MYMYSVSTLYWVIPLEGKLSSDVHVHIHVLGIKAMFTRRRFRWKTQLSLSVYAYRLHVNGKNGERKRIVLKTLTKV